MFVFPRGFFSPGHPDAGLEQIRATRIYPLAAAGDPPAMNQVDAAGVAIDALPPADHRYFKILADVLGGEPADREDFTMRGLAASLGIVPGQRFAPDQGLTEVLDASAAVGDKYAATVAFNPSDHLRVWPGRHWTSNMIPGLYVTADPEFNTSAYQDFDERLTFFYAAFSTSDAMFVAMPGKGSQYAGAFFDADGERPPGEYSYTLHTPADVPAANYWSLVVDGAETRCLLDNGDGLASIASNQNLILNADGSADLHFGPEPPRWPGQLDQDRPWTAGSVPCAFMAPPRYSSTVPGHPATSPRTPAASEMPATQMPGWVGWHAGRQRRRNRANV